MSHPTIPLAIVHHANQYLITNGYDNRPGIEEILGPLTLPPVYVQCLISIPATTSPSISTSAVH